MTIDQLLSEPGQQDKRENLSTTSFQFKRDVWDFFQGYETTNACEFGTHKGQTTRVLSYLFKHVFTFNLPGHFEEAELLNSDRFNISYLGIDLYKNTICPKEVLKYPISMFFLDAVHTFDAIMHDFVRATNMKLANEVYFVFDDYGMIREVYQAINQLISTGQLEKIKYIGHPPRHSFGGHPERIITDYEGVICRLK